MLFSSISLGTWLLEITSVAHLTSIGLSALLWNLTVWVDIFLVVFETLISNLIPLNIHFLIHKMGMILPFTGELL